MKKYSLFEIVGADLYRYTGLKTIKSFFRTYFFYHEFRYIFWMRVTKYLRQHHKLIFLHYLSRIVLNRLQYRTGIDIPYNTSIQPGFYIGHFGGIVVHPDVIIGWNCNISNRVTLGVSNRGERAGVPQIGNNVYIGPGAVIIGGIIVGNNAAIGANCVVTKDVPDSGVVVGVPGKVISNDGSEGYVDRAIPIF